MLNDKEIVVLIERWSLYRKQIIECSESHAKSGNVGEQQQLSAQAFGIKQCMDDLEALIGENHSEPMILS